MRGYVVLHSAVVPTRHRRVGVLLDPELDRALTLASDRLRARSAAARVRELALIGARSLGAHDAPTAELDRALDELGATRATRDLLTISRTLRERRHDARPADETPSESLRWVRGDR